MYYVNQSGRRFVGEAHTTFAKARAAARRYAAEGFVDAREGAAQHAWYVVPRGDEEGREYRRVYRRRGGGTCLVFYAWYARDDEE
jgi:hypothetical protein